jgi:hypothetical protein
MLCRARQSLEQPFLNSESDSCALAAKPSAAQASPSVQPPALDSSESRSEKKRKVWFTSLAGAAAILGISPKGVVELCQAGRLPAEFRKSKNWIFDEAVLVSWRESNRDILADGYGGNGQAEQLSSVQTASKAAPYRPVPKRCPDGACSAHWERRGRIVPSFKLDLCAKCFSGRPLTMK